ncbi:glucose 1-dehydrogenase [Sorangium sp. So ce124]|uniref:glucose 1-dehydrogenase n=1 Tax=Sorangium sp. So ce124 TaxID=3133280 RepID=UPI003F5F3698
MRSLAALMSERVVRLIEEDEPDGLRLAPGHVLLRTLEVGVCGTDREIAAFAYGSAPAGTDRLVLGHEALAEVVRTGAGVARVRPGDLVVPTVRRPCNRIECPACRVGHQDFCTTGQFVERGISGAGGFMTELFVEEERYLVPVPPAVGELGVLVEPLSVAAKAFAQLDAILARLPWDKDRAQALVLGAGPIGVLTAMGLVVKGYRTVVFSREPDDDDRAQIVRSIGADYVSSESTDIHGLASRMGRFDVIVEAVGVPEFAFRTLPALAVNGTFILTGVPAPRPEFGFDGAGLMHNFVMQNQVMFGTVNADHASYEAAVRMLEQCLIRFPDAVRRVIARRVALDEAPALLRAAGGGVKTVIQIGEASTKRRDGGLPAPGRSAARSASAGARER